jgi:hypothetical protein
VASTDQGERELVPEHVSSAAVMETSDAIKLMTSSGFHPMLTGAQRKSALELLVVQHLATNRVRSGKNSLGDRRAGR